MDAMLTTEKTRDAEAAIAPYLHGRRFSDVRAEFDERGYVMFPKVLTDDVLARIRDALAPWFEKNLEGRNDFEGVKTNRVYALLAKDPVFAELATHPLALAFAEADLGPSCLLSACLAIRLNPGESAQPWHHDDAHIEIPTPRPSYGVSCFWAIDQTTEENGATEILPGSHEWAFADAPGHLQDADFSTKTDPGLDDGRGGHPDMVKAILPAGGFMVAKGTLVHRGGPNRSGAPRTVITPQYCPGWARPLETMTLAVPPEKAATLPLRAQELLGYSIHAPFMGYVDGMHPKRILQ